MPDRWQERQQAIMNGVMSLLVSDCDMLADLRKAKQTIAVAISDTEKRAAQEHLQQAMGNLYEAVASKVQATLKVCKSEAEQMRQDRDVLSQQLETWRRVLEYITANVVSVAATEIQLLAAKTLGRG